MLNFLLVTVNIILTGVAGYLLLRRKSRFTPEWQKAVWYLLNPSSLCRSRSLGLLAA